MSIGDPEQIRHFKAEVVNRGTVDDQTATFNHIFQATGDLFFTGINFDGDEDRFINGNGTKSATFLQLKKL